MIHGAESDHFFFPAHYTREERDFESDNSRRRYFLRQIIMSLTIDREPSLKCIMSVLF